MTTIKTNKQTNKWPLCVAQMMSFLMLVLGYMNFNDCVIWLPLSGLLPPGYFFFPFSILTLRFQERERERETERGQEKTSHTLELELFLKVKLHRFSPVLFLPTDHTSIMAHTTLNLMSVYLHSLLLHQWLPMC